MKFIIYLTALFLLTFNSLHSQVEHQISKKTNLIEQKALTVKPRQSLFGLTTKKQSKEIKPAELDPTFFILGTLSDYMGRSQYVSEKDQIDRYYPFEKPLVEYLYEYIKTELNIEVDTSFIESNHSMMFSGPLSITLNNFYDLKDNIIEEKFTSDQQINSFLAGVYYRYGDKLDSTIYKIHLTNSPKHQNCYDFLKKVGCQKIFYKYLRNIPAQFILYFEPSPELKGYLELAENQRLLLKQSYHAMMSEMLDDFENYNIEYRAKELGAIKSAFE